MQRQADHNQQRPWSSQNPWLDGQTDPRNLWNYVSTLYKAGSLNTLGITLKKLKSTPFNWLTFPNLLAQSMSTRFYKTNVRSIKTETSCLLNVYPSCLKCCLARGKSVRITAEMTKEMLFKWRNLFVLCFSAHKQLCFFHCALYPILPKGLRKLPLSSFAWREEASTELALL